MTEKTPRDPVLESRDRNLTRLLREMQRVLVAFSGGVDSSFLLHRAVETLPRENVLGVTAVSEILPAREKHAAVVTARQLGAAHVFIQSSEMADPRFTANPHDKCYFCKKIRFGGLLELAASRGFGVVLDGENADDLQDYRPGSLAARELGVRSPLREVGLTKAQIRRLSRHAGLFTWNKPSCACLASRIPYHQPITPEKLGQIDAGEAFLLNLNLSEQVRVRHHGDTARIEVSPEDLSQFLDTALRQRIADYFKSLGFLFVTLDLEGYATGRLNRAVSQKEKEQPRGYPTP